MAREKETLLGAENFYSSTFIQKYIRPLPTEAIRVFPKPTNKHMNSAKTIRLDVPFSKCPKSYKFIYSQFSSWFS